MWEVVGIIAGFIWDGVQAGIAAVVTALAATVSFLWGAVIALFNAMLAVGATLMQGFQKAWDFVKATYDEVLKPAWDKLHELFTRVRDWLNDTFGPVLRFLRSVRSYILDFYKTWIRPVLDAIDATRQILKILEALHIAWAQALDNILGDIEDAVNHALIQVLGPLNKVIGIVNGVVTGNLLFQRVPFLRTLQRDLNPAWKLLTSAPSSSLSGDDVAWLGRAFSTQSPEELTDDIVEWFDGGENDVGATLDAMVQRLEDDWADAA